MTQPVLMMVTYNRLDLTKRTMSSLLANTPDAFRLVVVDNGSKDGTRQYWRAFEEGLPEDGQNGLREFRLLENEENKGIARGRNQALQAADEWAPEYYCTIDNDVEVVDGWLSECVEVLKANPSFGMMGLNMEGVDYPQATLGGHTFQEKPQGNLGTACMVFPAALHKMLGFFTTEYGLYGEEDADYGMRARVAGFKLGYLSRPGNHFGVGDLDEGEYRDFKTKCHKANLAQFNANAGAYYRREKPLHVPCVT